MAEAANHTNGTEEWAVGPVVSKLFSGDHANPREAFAAGWVKGYFGLDLRVYEDDSADWFQVGWHVTHLPTGYSVCSILLDLEQAKAITDLIAAFGDWAISDPEQCKAFGRPLYDLRAKVGNELIVRDTPLASPFFVSKQKADLAATPQVQA